MEKVVLAGIDVSARELVVAVDRGRARVQVRTLANDAEGHQRLVRWLRGRKRRCRVLVEATGIYSLDVSLALQRAEGIEVMVANPRTTRDFARAQLQRSKTDRTDARTLLEFVRRMAFVSWEPPTREILDLQALSRRISGLLCIRAQEKNRLHAHSHVAERTRAIRQSLERHIDHVNQEIELLTQEALALIAGQPDLERWYGQLVSVPGIARASAVTLLAELAVLPDDMTARQWVAHAGLDPRHHESGASVRGHQRISKVGNRRLRAALFMPALVAVQHAPHVRAYYRALLDRGKKPKQAIVAVMRKLLHAIHGMAQNGTNFDGRKFFEMKA